MPVVPRVLALVRLAAAAGADWVFWAAALASALALAWLVLVLVRPAGSAWAARRLAAMRATIPTSAASRSTPSFRNIRIYAGRPLNGFPAFLLAVPLFHFQWFLLLSWKTSTFNRQSRSRRVHDSAKLAFASLTDFCCCGFPARMADNRMPHSLSGTLFVNEQPVAQVMRSGV
jgi:hypothetical protein